MISCMTLSDRKPKLSILAFDSQCVFILRARCLLGIHPTCSRPWETCNNPSQDYPHRTQQEIITNFIPRSNQLNSSLDLKHYLGKRTNSHISHIRSCNITCNVSTSSLCVTRTIPSVLCWLMNPFQRDFITGHVFHEKTKT